MIYDTILSLLLIFILLLKLYILIGNRVVNEKILISIIKGKKLACLGMRKFWKYDYLERKGV